MPKLKRDCSPGEIARYEQSYLATWDTVNDGIRYVAVKAEDQNLLPAERLELMRQHARLSAERALLEAKRQGFRANQKPINPPNSTKVSQARQLAEDSDAVIRQSQAVDQAITIAEQAVALFNTIQAA
jgi:hypothetical protein